jgi:hypothetical protein
LPPSEKFWTSQKEKLFLLFLAVATALNTFFFEMGMSERKRSLDGCVAFYSPLLEEALKFAPQFPY